MASDIFGFNAQHGGSFKKGSKGAMFSAGGDVKLVQNWNVSYQLQVQQIYECGWDEDYVAAENSVMVCISKLRAKLADDPQAYIKTIRGLGYRLER